MRQCVENPSKTKSNVKTEKKGQEIVRMNSLSVMARWIHRKPNHREKKASHSLFGNDGVQNISPIFYSIVNLIYSQMRKLNFKLNYLQADFYLSTARPMFYLHNFLTLAKVLSRAFHAKSLPL